jgi:hypothetical protein
MPSARTIHWLQQILLSPEATQIVKWPTQRSTITCTRPQPSVVRGGWRQCESDTINVPPETIAGIPIFGPAHLLPIFATILMVRQSG